MNIFFNFMEKLILYIILLYNMVIKYLKKKIRNFRTKRNLDKQIKHILNSNDENSKFIRDFFSKEDDDKNDDELSL